MTLTRFCRVRSGAAFLALACATTALADEYEVPGDYDTIGEAVANAAPGDIIKIHDGVHAGAGNRGILVDIPITLESVSGDAKACTVDCESLGRVFHITADATVRGFTIANGSTTGLGGAILIDGANPTIEDCVFTSNQAVSDGTGAPFNPMSGNGGALAYINGGGGEIWFTCFSDNLAEATGETTGDILSGIGGAIQVGSGSELALFQCEFTGNVASSPGIAGNGFGGAIATDLFSSAPALLTIIDSTFTSNEADIAGGAVWIFGGHTVLIENSDFMANTGQSAGAVAFQGMTDMTIRGGEFTENHTLATITFGTPGVQEQIGGGAVAGGTGSTLLIEDVGFLFNTSAAGRGGAVSLFDDSTGQFINCSFTGNEAFLEGGAVVNAEAPAVAPFSDDDTFPSTMMLIGCTFIENSTVLNGGAVATLEDSMMSVVNCGFKANSVTSSGVLTGHGGALYAMGGMIEILGGSFIANTAITTDDDQDAGLGGAILFGDGIVASVRATMFDFNSATGPGVFGNGIGGALFIGGSDDTSDPVRLPSHVTVDECDFQGNAAAIAAGAIWLQGRNAGALPPSTLDLRDSFFESNNAGNGGAMTIFGSGVASVEDCIFTANYVPLVDSPIGGGAVSAGFFNVSTFTNCLFMDNTSAGVGGAVSGVAGSTHMLFNCEFRNNEAAGPGGALYNSSYFDIPSTMSAVNCLLACNTADEGAGAYNEAGCNLSMVNCTLGHNVADTGGGGLANVGEGAVAEFLNGILWENDAPIDPQILEGPGIVTVFFSIVEGGWPGTGNLSTPPAWIDADADDCPDGNYRLSELSPAIDAGDPRLVTTVFDLDGLDRVVGNSVDLGAYEFQSIPCPTDLTGNGVTDVEDLVIVISGWGTPAGDVNGDGMTDVVDLTLVITAWGACE